MRFDWFDLIWTEGGGGERGWRRLRMYGTQHDINWIPPTRKKHAQRKYEFTRGGINGRKSIYSKNIYVEASCFCYSILYIIRFKHACALRKKIAVGKNIDRSSELTHTIWIFPNQFHFLRNPLLIMYCLFMLNHFICASIICLFLRFMNRRKIHSHESEMIEWNKPYTHIIYR